MIILAALASALLTAASVRSFGGSDYLMAGVYFVLALGFAFVSGYEASRRRDP